MVRALLVRATVALAVAVLAPVAASTATPVTPATYGYDGVVSTGTAVADQQADDAPDLLLRGRSSTTLEFDYTYDDRSQLARASARPGEYRLAPNTAGSIRRVNPLGGTQNCVNCAIATDATLAGRPASALTSSGPQPISGVERTFGGSFKPVSGADEIQQLLMDAGPGSRVIVFGSRGADPGHVFNAVNQRGIIRFLDGQSGGPASFEGFDAFHFLRTDL